MPAESEDYGSSGLYRIEEHPESVWPAWVVWRAGRFPIARFADEGGAQRWIDLLERTETP